MKHVSIMLSDGFFSAESGALVKIVGIIGSSKYQSILAQNLQVSVRQLKMKKNMLF